MNMGRCSLRSWIVTPTLALSAISLDSMDLTSMTCTCRFSFNSWSGVVWMWAKSRSRNAMPVDPQSISTFVDISWLFTVNVQVITKSSPSIDTSNTSTLQTDKREIPKHFKVFKTELFLSTGEPSFSNWLNLFLIPRNLSHFLHPLLPLQPP